MLSSLNKLSTQDLRVFQIIVDFTTNVQDYFGGQKHVKSRAIDLYHRLVSKTSFQEDQYIRKHIQLFREFCTLNRSMISKQTTPLTDPVIRFSQRIYIDVNYLFQHADDETTQTLWKYILTLSAILDPLSNAQELLKDLHDPSDTTDNTQESDFLSGLFQTMGSQFTDSTHTQGQGQNPFEMMLSSGMMSQMMNHVHENLEHGNIDLSKLMGTMQTLIGNLQQEMHTTTPHDDTKN